MEKKKKKKEQDHRMATWFWCTYVDIYAKVLGQSYVLYFNIWRLV